MRVVPIVVSVVHDEREGTIGAHYGSIELERILARAVQASLEQATPTLREWFEIPVLRRQLEDFLLSRSNG